MKVLMRGTGGNGVILLDPLRLPEIVRNSARGCANGVLTNEHLIASTIPLTAHDDSTRAAGIELEDIHWPDPVPGTGHIRLQMDADTVEAEFWYPDADIVDGRCPVSASQLSTVVDWIAGHTRIRQAYLGGPAPRIQVTLLSMDGGGPLWIFQDGLFLETENTPVVASPAA